MDAFFASVEQRDHPEWKGKPVIVGGLPGEPRSVVSTASYEARKFGVHSAMPVFKAVKLCPDGIFTHGNHRHYAEISMQIMQILSKYSPDLRQVSIDEASMDLTGTELLFGEPDALALKIQKEIFNETKLTVSIGLASNAYLAKLASEVNKPNGFFAIPMGQEENFMLSIPLKKVWGIGTKTLEKLNKNGFFTTKDIFLRSKGFLISVFGECAGTFLYNSVRGIETPAKGPSAHSISSEITFPEDISNIYTAETALMELCQCIMFRLLREESFSKTVFLKIRYDDFSTFTFQQTFSDYVTSSDDFFEKIKSVFEKKYEEGRGIRLLGAGLENIQGKDAPVQEVLFDFGEKKKQAVENAILKLSSKNPEIKIQKARTLNNKMKALPLIFATLLLFSRKNADAEDYISKNNSESAGSINSPSEMLPFPKESPGSLFNFNINDSEIVFLADGWWNIETEGQLNATYSSKNGFNSSTPNFVFRQKAELSFLFMLNRQLFFSANFADEFTKNTITAGFYGKDLNPLKEFKISNRNIVFPDYYSMSLFQRSIGGGENQAPGISARFESPLSKKWTADFAFRYDMNEQRDATFYGKNSVTSDYIELSNFMTGQFFSLPEKLISSIKEIYIENQTGNYTDEKKRRFKKLSEDEFITVESKKLLIISADSGGTKKNGKKPAVLATFYNQDLKTALGSYSDTSGGKNISFLKEVQEVFGEKIKLEKYTNSLTGVIENSEALVLQEATGFSPFLCANYYDLGISGSAKVKIGNMHSEEKNNDFSIEIAEDFENFISPSFLNTKHAFAKIFINDNTEFEFSAENRFPLAKKIPEAYLNTSSGTDLKIIVQKYNPVSTFNIGTNAEANSVKVYRNGILTSGAEYDSESGAVKLSFSVSDMDKIYITWNETSGDAKSGALAGQAAFKYFFTPDFSGDISIAADWTVSPFAEFSEYNRNAGGYAAFSAGLDYSTENLKFSTALAAVYEKQDVTDKYRIEGFDDAQPATWYLEKNSGLDLENEQIPALNPRPDSSESGEKLKPAQNFTVTGSCSTGEKDSHISGYKIPLEWNFPSGSDSSKISLENAWAACNIKLPAGDILKNSSVFRIALQLAQPLPKAVDVYLQLGVHADENPDAEETEKIPTWKLNINKEIYAGSQDADKNIANGWQTVEVKITDYDKSYLAVYHDARLIVKSNSENPALFHGIIYAGPYETVPEGLSVSAADEANIKTEQIKDNSVPEKKTFNSDDNFSQKISWNFESPVDEQKKNIIIGKFLNETDISSYKYLKFFYKNANFKEFSLIMDKDAAILSENGTEALNLKFNGQNLEHFNRTDGKWHSLEINLLDKSVSIDGTEIPGENFSISIRRNKMPSRLKIAFTPAEDKGEFCMDEFFLEKSSAAFNFQNISKFQAKRSGTLVSAKNFPLVQDAIFQSELECGTSIPEENDFNKNGFIHSVSSAEITLATIKFYADADFSSDEENLLASASHSVKTTEPLLKILDASDEFVFNRADSSTEKASEAVLDLKKLKIPVSVNAKSKGEKNRWNSSNEMESGISFNLNKEKWNALLKTEISASQKIPAKQEELDKINSQNYAENYADATCFSFNSGSGEATRRNVRAKVSSRFSVPFIKLSPEIIFSAHEKYSGTNSAKHEDSQILDILIPFSIKKTNFTLKYSKTGTKTEAAEYGGNYRKDFEELFDSMKNSGWYFNAAPFQDFFDTNFSDSIFSHVSKSGAENLYYSGKYTFSFKRPLFADEKDFFIPAAFDFSSERRITAASDLSGFYILRASALNTPMNIFGSQSKSGFFRWFKTDEYAISVSGTVKIPETSPSDVLWNLNFYAQAGFYINDADIIRTGFETEISPESEWKITGSARYKRRVKRNLLSEIIKAADKKKNKKPKLSRTDSIDFTLNYDSEDDFINQNYDFAHKISAEISDFISFDCGFSFSLDLKKEITAFGVSGTAGGKITF